MAIPSRGRRRRGLAATLVTLLAAGALTLSGASAANAAPGDYTVELEAPPSVAIYDPFTYTATLEVEATTEAPASGIVLTSVLDEGLTFDSAPTGADSPIASYTYDPATRTVTFVMKDLTEQLSSFTYSVRQTENNVKDSTTNYETSLSGSSTPSGATPADSTVTDVTGDLEYRTSKSYTVLEGSGNRQVTYYFNVGTANGSGATTETFTSWSQRLTDTLPAGAQIVATSTWEGTWTTTTNGDGTTTATWLREAPYGPNSTPLDGQGDRIWIQVFYPSSSFPEGAPPPANTVSLTVTDHSGASNGPWTGSTQSPEIIDGRTKGVFLSKFATGNSADSVTLASGGWRGNHVVAASYLNSLDNDQLGSLTVEDAATMSEANAAFFDHVDIHELRFSFNPALQAADLPYTVEYMTTAGGWRTYDTQGATTGTNARLVVQVEGSERWTDDGGVIGIELPKGEHLTGWRVVVSPGADSSIPANSEVRVRPLYVPSYTSLTGGAPADATLVNTATAEGTTVAGTTFSAEDPAEFTILDRVNIITQVVAPGTLNVGGPATFVANISNLDPAGRTYDDSVMKVVLPVGVVYDASIGASPVYATTPASGLTVPTVGNGVTVTTETVTDEEGEHQVVVFRFDELPSLWTAGEPKSRLENYGFRYNIPTNVLPQAYDSSDTSVPVTSWAYTDDPDYSGMRMDFSPSYYSGDTYDFSATLDRIARSGATSVVTTAGGLLLGKQVRADAGDSFALESVVQTPGTAEWQVYVANVLPQDVSDIVVFDRLPVEGDDRDSTFAVTLSGPITGLPSGATVEYSTDAKTVDSGTWTSNPSGAVAFRVTIPKLANGENVTLSVPTTVPTGVDYLDEAVNDVTATGVYNGAERSFASNEARITAEGTPAFTLVKRTNGVEYDAAPGALVATGSAVTWTYDVTNTGDTPLDSIQLSDAYTAGDGSTGTLTPTSTATGPLQPGETRTFTATGTAVTGQYHNTATATAVAVDEDGEALGTQPDPVTDESWYLAGTAGLTIEKTTNGEDVDSAPGLPLVPGSDVTWTYTVTNTGELPLTDIVVVDVTDGGDEVFRDVIASLAPDESVTLEASGTATEGQYHNTVTAEADDPSGSGEQLAAADDSWYFGVTSGLTIEKTVSDSPDGPWAETVNVPTGGTAYWRVVVTNSGNSPLTGVTVSDQSLDRTENAGTLAPGASVEYIFQEDGVTTAHTNVAAVTGVDPLSETLSADDDAAVTVAAAAGSGGGGGLAITGAEIGLIVGIAIVLLAIGTLVLLARRVGVNRR